jgi:hypothetical protein
MTAGVEKNHCLNTYMCNIALHKMVDGTYAHKEHFSARISSFLVLKIRDKAKKEGRFVTSVVEDG